MPDVALRIMLEVLTFGVGFSFVFAIAQVCRKNPDQLTYLNFLVFKRVSEISIRGLIASPFFSITFESLLRYQRLKYLNQTKSIFIFERKAWCYCVYIVNTIYQKKKTALQFISCKAVYSLAHAWKPCALCLIYREWLQSAASIPKHRRTPSFRQSSRL